MKISNYSNLFCIVFTIILLISTITYAEKNPVALYSFDGHVNDLSGNNNHGKAVNILFSEDRFGNANSSILLKNTYDNNADSYVIIKDCEALRFTNNLSISVWYMTTTFEGYDHIIAKPFGGTASNTFNIWRNGAGLCFDLLTTKSNDGIYHIFDKRNKWHHIVGVWDGEIIRLFFNGVEVSSKNLSGQLVYDDEKSPVIIGADDQNGDGNPDYGLIDGKIDALSFYNRAISENEVYELFNESNNYNLKDSDNDGVIDQWDSCPKTPENSCVNNKGCSCELSILDEKGSVIKGKWKTYYASIDNSYSNFTVRIQDLTEDVDLYVKKGSKPDFNNYDCRPYKGGKRDEICDLNNSDDTLWYFSVYGYKAGDFTISVKAKR